MRPTRADLHVARLYDRARSGYPYDMTHRRRRAALRRLEEQVETDTREPTERELVVAFERLVARRAGGRGLVASGVLAALDDVRRSLGLRRPAILEEAWRYRVYSSGASRRSA